MKVIQRTKEKANFENIFTFYILLITLSYSFFYILGNLKLLTPFVFGLLFGMSLLVVLAYLSANFGGDEEEDEELKFFTEETELLPIRELEELDSKELSKCSEENLDELIDAIDDEVLKLD